MTMASIYLPRWISFDPVSFDVVNFVAIKDFSNQ